MKGGTRSENQQDPLTCSRDPHPTLGNLHTIPLVSALAQGGLCSMPGLETPPPGGLSEVFSPHWTPISSSVLNQKLNLGLVLTLGCSH